MNTHTEENYLKALFYLTAERGEVNVNDLSKHLGIQMPTATSMMKKLGEKKLVQYESYKPIKLSDKGKKEASLIIRKHRLTEMFLVEKMGFGWENVHPIAEQVEHVDSPDFFDRMDEMLGFPKMDPHGSPIPDKDGKISWQKFDKLSDCKVGESAKLSAVMHSSDEFLKHLNARELQLGVVVKVISVEPFDGMMVVSYGKRKSETLSSIVCERLLVQRA